WSYGTTGTALGGPFSLLPHAVSPALGMFSRNPNVVAWEGDQVRFTDGFPLVAKNTAATTEVGGDGFVVLLPGQLIESPGPNGESSVVRLTTPSDGTYAISGFFEGRDLRNPTTDVHVLLNNAAIFNGNITQFGPVSDQPFSMTLTLHTGDT